MVANLIYTTTNRTADALPEAGTEPSARSVNQREIVNPATLDPAAKHGSALRPGHGYLASFDLVTAVAVIGSVDALQGRETIIPPLDFSATTAKVPPADLTEFGLEDLMAVEVAPATPPVDVQNFDLGDSDLGLLLTLEAQPVEPQDEASSVLTLVAIEDLLEVAVGPVETEQASPPFDLSGIDLEILQDLSFDTDPQDPVEVFRQVAPPDIATPLDQDSVNDVGLIDRTTEPRQFAGNPLSPSQARTIGVDADGGGRLPPPPANQQPSALDDQLKTPRDTDSATAGTKVIKVNLAPAIKGDDVATPEDTPVIVDVLANDHDPDGDPLTIDSAVQGANGAVMVNTDGTLTYTPDPDFHGTDSFTYTVSDPYGACETATVTVTVTPANDAPVAGDDSFVLPMNTNYSGGVLSNDRDPDGDSLTVSDAGIRTTLRGGTAVLEADGTFDFKPKTGFTGTDSFAYTIEDGRGGTASATATFTVTAPGTILDGTDGDDRLIGTPGTDTMDGKGGNDEMSGGNGDDHLFGGAGDDILVGGRGDDVLSGGFGNDTLLGDQGSETFVFAAGSGSDVDTIEDFVSGQDVIDLGAFGLAGLSELTIRDDGSGGSLIALPSGDSIDILLVDPTSLTAGDIVF